jgi:hypothetical protein
VPTIEYKEDGAMTNILKFTERKTRLLGSVGVLSTEMQSDVQYMVSLASRLVEAAEEAGADISTANKAEPTVVVVPPRMHQPAEDLPNRKLRKRRRRQSKKTRIAKSRLSTESISPEQKDQHRLHLLRLDSKGGPNAVRRYEDKLRQKYKSFGLKFRSSGMRTHMHGEYRGRFVARLLARAATLSSRNALLRELAELYKVSKETLRAEVDALNE